MTSSSPGRQNSTCLASTPETRPGLRASGPPVLWFSGLRFSGPSARPLFSNNHPRLAFPVSPLSIANRGGLPQSRKGPARNSQGNLNAVDNAEYRGIINSIDAWRGSRRPDEGDKSGTRNVPATLLVGAKPPAGKPAEMQARRARRYGRPAGDVVGWELAAALALLSPGNPAAPATGMGGGAWTSSWTRSAGSAPG